jgi:hypothetical protein
MGAVILAPRQMACAHSSTNLAYCRVLIALRWYPDLANHNASGRLQRAVA